ncbi:MAG: MAPEG family protein [Lysobacterales bacterium]
MTIAYWCVMIAAFLPLLYTGIAKFSGPGFNNHTPRDFQAQLQGFRQRAHWAHLNSFEAFPPFAVAVIIAHQLGLQQSTLDALAIGFIVARLAYGAFYLADMATLRSLAWVAAVGCWVTMLVKLA